MLRFTSNALFVAGFEVRYYGICVLLGVAAAIIIDSAREKRYSLKKDTCIDLALICVPVGIVCARIYYCAFEWRSYISDPWKVFDIRGGGLAIYGGLIGAFAAGWVYSRIKKLSYLTLCDIAAPGVAAAQAIGRWGNFFNQEAYGGVVYNTGLRFFPFSVYIDAIGQWRYATFFFESAWCALTAAALLIFEKKGAFKKRGDVFFCYVLLYAAERCAVEAMRSDSLYIGAFRVSQMLSALAMIAVSLLFMLRSEKKDFIGLAAAFPPLVLALLSAPGGAVFAVSAICIAANAIVYAPKTTLCAK